MFSEASVHGGGGMMSLPVFGPMFFPGGSAYWEGGLPTRVRQGLPQGECLLETPLVMTSGSGHCSSWNAFLFNIASHTYAVYLSTLGKQYSVTNIFHSISCRSLNNNLN